MFILRFLTDSKGCDILITSKLEVFDMKYQSVEQAVEALRNFEALMHAYDHVMGVTYLDAALPLS